MTPSDWPFFDIRITTPQLELRPPKDQDFPDLLDVIRGGIHDPSLMPFGQPWTDADSPERERNALKWWWRQRAELSPENWTLGFAVFLRGQPVGMQDVAARDFAKRKAVFTGSWLGQKFQGRGIGKEMRAAVVTLAFVGLDADVAMSESFADNPQSAAVSRAVGYEEDGHGRWAPRGEPVDSIRWRLTRERFEKLRADGHYAQWEPVTIAGLDPCLPLLGVT